MTARMVRCASCGTLNRIKGYSGIRIPVCGKCHIALPERAFAKITRKLFRWTRSLVIVMTALVVSGAVYFGIIAVIISLGGKAPAIDRLVACASTEQPTEGVYTVSDYSPRVARLTVRVATGANYFVKLEHAGTRRPVMSFFIYGGSTLEAMVPLGDFTLKYATGKMWCGEAELFGPDTLTNKAEKLFRFERRPTEDGYTLSHWVVELVLQRGGNLRTARIPRETF